MGLLLHCTASPVTLTDLAKVKAVKPQGASDIFQPIKHIDLVNTIKKQCKANDIEITKSNWGLTNDKLGLFGHITLRHKELPKIKEMEYALGVRHANNRKMSLRFAVGGNVFVCDNMALIGDFVLSRRHTTGLELEESINEGLQSYIEQAKELPKMKPELEKIKITPELEHKILTVSAYGEEEGFEVNGKNPPSIRLLRPSHLWELHNEWMHPRHKDFQPRNGWSLYNCYTEIMKQYRPDVQFKGAKQFLELIIKTCNN